MALTPGARLGPYEILEPLRSGGMGEVYRARDTRLGRLVAVKTLPAEIGADPQRMARLDLEARTISTLSHPNICALFDVGEHEGLPFLVLELVEGEPLDERLRRGPVPLDRALAYGIQLADALDQAHARGVVHRDLKPSNIMITAGGVKLLDFGLAKPIVAVATSGGDPLPTVTLSAEGQMLGTVQYMAPEQLAGKPADARTDIFALGAALYEMVAGRRAFPGETAAVEVAAIMTKEATPLAQIDPTVPPALDHVVRRCLEKDPADRWQTARDLRHELEWIARGSGMAGAPRGAQTARRIGRAARWLVALAAGAAILAAAIVTWNRLAPSPVLETHRGHIRFPVLPPQGGEFLAIGNFMALSPNGRHLAYAASQAGGATLLWVRDLDGVEARPLVGTDGAVHPFWSPDSRTLAFMTATEVKRVDVAGGPPRVICEVAANGGAWGPSGDILLNSRADGRLYRVPANGGTPVPETTLDNARGETRHLWPQFLPDGRSYLFLAVSEDASRTGLFAGTLGQASRDLVMAVNSSVAFVAQGYLLWRQDTRLVAQRFDASTRQLSGDVTTLLDGVWHSWRTLRGVFSASDAGVLAYQPLPTGALAWYNRQGRALRRIDSTRFSSPAVSRDGRYVAVSQLDRESGTHDTWVYDNSTGRGIAVSPNPAEDFAPTWSPDGGRLAFASTRVDGITRLYVHHVSDRGDAQVLVTWNEREVRWPADWSPDGDVIVLEHGRGVETFSFTTGQVSSVFRIDRGSVRHSRLSPDGRWLAYSSDESGRPEIYVRAFPRGGEPVRVSADGGAEPAWRGDGREIYFVGLDRTMMAVTMDRAAGLRPGRAVPLFSTRVRPVVGPGLLGRNQHTVTPDGQQFIVSEFDDAELTVLVNWTSLLQR